MDDRFQCRSVLKTLGTSDYEGMHMAGLYTEPLVKRLIFLLGIDSVEQIYLYADEMALRGKVENKCYLWG